MIVYGLLKVGFFVCFFFDRIDRFFYFICCLRVCYLVIFLVGSIGEWDVLFNRKWGVLVSRVWNVVGSSICFRYFVRVIEVDK